MRKRNHILYLSLLLGSFSTQAQETKIYRNAAEKYDHAASLYRENLYAVAQVLFDDIRMSDTNSELEANSAYYSANIALQLGQEAAGHKIKDFVYDYPTSSKQTLALLDLSTYYFNLGEYEEALRYANAVNANVLSQKQKDRLNFQRGYGFFVKKNYNAAKIEFEKIKENSIFEDQAKYYLGYISYDKNDYSQASQYFEEVSDIEKYQEKMGYYKADMYFKTADFNKAIEEGLKQLPKSNNQEKSELSKIIGESYFNLGQYANALPYLLNYEGKNGRWSNTDFYQLGYTYYKQNDFERTISEFNKIIGGSDAVAQNAYYHLGESYLKLNQKTQALNAFKNASELKFNERITEDAFANYAKLSYDIGNPYVSVPEVITTFLATYPNSAYKQELEDLLIDSYVTTKNYQAALDLLEKNKSNLNKGVYQKVTFYRGVEFFNEGKYNQALTLFNKSIAERHDNRFVSRATFWRAEAQYALGNFSDALSTLETFINLPQAKNTPEYNNASYTMGYVHFKMKNYGAAQQHFESFISKTSSGQKKLDAQLRLADTYFVQGKYAQATTAYQSIIQNQSTQADYAAFQKALSNGFMQKNDVKIAELQSFLSTYPNSSYADDAMYELGATFANIKQTNQSIQAFNNLIQKYPNSPYVSSAILRQGLVYYNAGDNIKAIERFKKVVYDYPGTDDAIQAVQNARIAYNESGQAAEFANWVRTVDFVDISTAELESDAYEIADKLLAQGKKVEAFKGFKDYLKQYPNGTFAFKANFNVAEILFADGKTSEAKTHYQTIISKSKNEYTEPSLVRLSTIALIEKRDEESIAFLKQLDQVASNDQNVLFAQSNLMKVYFNQNKLAEASEFANKVIKNTKADKKVLSDAYVILGRQAIANGNASQAKSYYDNLAKVGVGEAAAEALYYDAYFKTEDKKFEASNTVIQKLAKDYSAYQYFGAKGLILMAKNFYGLKDSYQATYVLENVVSNFKQYPDVVQEAQTLLNQYKSQESKRNSSVK